MSHDSRPIDSSQARSLCIVYLASPRNKGNRLTTLQTSLRITRQVFPLRDIIVFNEDLLKGDLPADVKSVQIDFSGLEHRFLSKSSRQPYGYHMMCRFFSGIMQAHPALAPYTHYMRLDDDSFFMHPCQIPEAAFLKADYVYRTIFTEEGHDQQALFLFTQKFLRQRRLPFLKFNKQLAPYNNFHVASLAMWKQPLVQAYLAELETENLILGHSILDANIHAFIVWAIFPHTALKLHVETGFGYRHNHHVSRLGSTGLRFLPHISFAPRHTDIETQAELGLGP